MHPKMQLNSTKSTRITADAAKNTPKPGQSKALPPPPPAYGSLDVSGETTDAIEAAWEKKCPKNWQTQALDNLTFRFSPEAQQTVTIGRFFRNRKEHPGWCAAMWIRARNIPRLMRRGFYWSAANIIKGEDRLLLDDFPIPFLRRHRRTCRLIDVGQHPEWEAMFCVESGRRDTVINFDMNRVTMNTVVEVEALDWDGKTIYFAQKRSGLFFNSIFDQMPLDGWWPWPKGSGEEAVSVWRKGKKNRG